MLKNIKEKVGRLVQSGFTQCPELPAFVKESAHDIYTISDDGDAFVLYNERTATDKLITPKIISFYTDDSIYAKRAEVFLQSLNDLKIDNYYVEKIESGKNWEENCSYKAKFIEKCLKEFKEPVLWIDIDTVVNDIPLIPQLADFAIHLWDGWEFATGTVFFNYTDGGLKLVSCWTDLAATKPVLWDQMLLDEAWSLTSRKHDLVTYWLDKRYTYIYDSGAVEHPIVTHLQASRDVVKLNKPEYPDSLTQTRRKRLPSEDKYDLSINTETKLKKTNAIIEIDVDNLVSYLLSIRQEKPFSFIQVGAMDGKKFDPIFHHVSEAMNVKGVLLEPNREMFEQLRINYKNKEGLEFLNMAIDSVSGCRVLHKIPQKHIESGDIPEWALGISSFYNDRNALGGKQIDDETFEKLRAMMVEESVECTTFDTLLGKDHFAYLDLLQIDTEGHDWQVLSTFPIDVIKPLVINFEYYNMPQAEIHAALEWLDTNGYFWSRNHKDVTATLLRIRRND
ncbi:FkbM family methyltransferase [Alteromonas sp. C1M14]|uniref:FkbM family methyltransferase n=1 Tax=Alteromonas sp. C1M14 TaxID=2841567 RepID=UPI001C08C7EF|nr:FkbM family methyltransferase [Alteromonas sp. C1M14]MBU2977956.1 FkbM family methyltransferase [Alteromonas sp. C1M14]